MNSLTILWCLSGAFKINWDSLVQCDCSQLLQLHCPQTHSFGAPGFLIHRAYAHTDLFNCTIPSSPHPFTLNMSNCPTSCLRILSSSDTSLEWILPGSCESYAVWATWLSVRSLSTCGPLHSLDYMVVILRPLNAEASLFIPAYPVAKHSSWYIMGYNECYLEWNKWTPQDYAANQAKSWD